jgi:mannosyltransferase OCH1-like enzyme
MKTKIQVSQIFLTLYEGTSINDFEVFVKSCEMFKSLTNKYTLYDDKKANALMKNYPEFYSMWKNVKYGIMKVDILRFIILYHYGGFYADLDVIPRVNNLKELVKDVPNDSIVLFTPEKKVGFNYEVMYAYKGNEYFLDFLRYVKEQIKNKDKMDIYKTWKGRYILQTTGPQSFKRFIKLHPNPNLIMCNKINGLVNKKHFEDVMKNKHSYYFISLQTSSWLKSLGVKDYKDKDAFRDKITKWLEKDLTNY